QRVEVLANPRQMENWIAAAEGKPVDWDALFQGYRATVDWPACNFYEVLAARYPDAKVILSVRDADRWYESAFRTIYFVRRSYPSWAAFLIPRMRAFRLMLDRLVWVRM